ncbi:DUF512 domain-containing protein [Clostridia bacterium OttesenSCG-928-O13]|nr:DUF512 domain-containing protein [Clostridia bacterium OttesenSCG-928-O13]
MAVSIHSVAENSPAAKAGILPGMSLVSVDGKPIFDGLDYEFYTAGPRLRLVVEAGGARREILIEKEEYQPLGCGFETYLIDKQHACKNKCVFCFIDQLPKGMRAPLYFKDDDERLGFLFGNYITLTNLSQREVDRILAMRFSPVNISVHTANPALRVEMMGNKNAGKVLDIIPQLAKAGIEMNFQLVLCPGLNDGAELEHSLAWLAAQGPSVRSIAAVPVGLTRHRQGLCPLVPYTGETAAAQLDSMLEAGDAFLGQRGSRLIYPSDEWFLLAGRPIPPADFYEDYPQLENGVGMWRVLLDEFTEALAAAPGGPQKAEADLVVGTLAAPLFEEINALLVQKYPNARLYVHGVKNDFFGHGVTVTGLLTGRDVMAQLQGQLGSGRLFLPADTLRAEGDVMLDEVSPEDLAQALSVRVEVLPKGGDILLEALLDEGE